MIDDFFHSPCLSFTLRQSHLSNFEVFPQHWSIWWPGTVCFWSHGSVVSAATPWYHFLTCFFLYMKVVLLYCRRKKIDSRVTGSKLQWYWHLLELSYLGQSVTLAYSSALYHKMLMLFISNSTKVALLHTHLLPCYLKALVKAHLCLSDRFAQQVSLFFLQVPEVLLNGSEHQKANWMWSFPNNC